MAGAKGRSGGARANCQKARTVGSVRWVRDQRRARKAGPVPATPKVLTFAPEVPPVPMGLLKGLRAPGRAFVADVWTTFEEIPPDDVRVLHEAAGSIDLLADLEAAIAKDGAVVNGAPNPLLRVQRQTRTTLVLLINKLGLKAATV